MDGQPHYREFVEQPEYAAQMDAIVAKYSVEIIDRVLRGVFWGLATNPVAYERLWGPFRIAKTRSLGLELPMFRIFFQIENEGTSNERILLCWVDEIDDFGDTVELR
jgi:hypothetical protein